MPATSSPRSSASSNRSRAGACRRSARCAGERWCVRSPTSRTAASTRSVARSASSGCDISPRCSTSKVWATRRSRSSSTARWPKTPAICFGCARSRRSSSMGSRTSRPRTWSTASPRARTRRSAASSQRSGFLRLARPRQRCWPWSSAASRSCAARARRTCAESRGSARTWRARCSCTSTATAGSWWPRSSKRASCLKPRSRSATGLSPARRSCSRARWRRWAGRTRKRWCGS